MIAEHPTTSTGSNHKTILVLILLLILVLMLVLIPILRLVLVLRLVEGDGKENTPLLFFSNSIIASTEKKIENEIFIQECSPTVAEGNMVTVQYSHLQ